MVRSATVHTRPVISAVPTIPEAPEGLRIAVIAETVTTGVGRHLADLIPALAEQGHTIHLLYSPARTNPAFLEKIQQAGAVCTPIAMRRAPGPWDLTALVKILSYLRKHGPFDVIHGQSSKGGALARLVAPIVGGVCVYTPHAFITMTPDLSAGMRAIYRTAEFLLGLMTDRVICVSSLEAEHARTLGLPDRKISIIPNGIESNPDLAPKVYSTAPIIGFIGRLDRQKAPELVLEAATILKFRGSKLRFRMIGDGPQRDILMRMTAERDLQGTIEWLGAVDARPLLADCDMLVMPSRYEGFPYSLLEALANGLAVIATPVGGVAELVQNGVNGIVVPFNDPVALADAIARLDRNPALLSTMQQASRERVLGFSIMRMARATISAYAARPRVAPESRAPSGIAGS